MGNCDESITNSSSEKIGEKASIIWLTGRYISVCEFLKPSTKY